MLSRPLLLRKRDFPILADEDWIYLDTAATAQKPESVIRAMNSFYREGYATINRAVYQKAQEATAAYYKARGAVQRFIGAATTEEIIFTRNATGALNLLARSFGETFLQRGDVILISEIEHHSNIVPWQMIAEKQGAQLRILPVDDRGEILMEELEELLDERVKLLSIAHISNVIGTVHPVKEIIEKAHEYGVYVVLDGAQAAGHIPIDVGTLDVDFYVFSGHKMYGPTGIGVLYGKEALLEQLKPVEGGGDNIERVSFEETTWAALPQKFEPGTPPIVEAIGLEAAIGYIEEIGIEVIEEHEKELMDYLLGKLEQIPGVQLIGNPKRRGSLVSFIVDGVHPLDLGTLLDCRQVAMRTGHHCSQLAMERFGVKETARASLGLYTTKEDIDRFISALVSVLNFLKETSNIVI